MSLFKKKDKDPPNESAPMSAAAVPAPQPSPQAAPQPAPQGAASPGATAGEGAPALDQTALQNAMAASQRRHMALGQMMALLANTPQFQGATLVSVMALAAPAIATGQFAIAMGQSNQNGVVAPLGVAIWASVSDEVDQRLSSDLDQPFTIASNEWLSGPHAWLLLTAGDQRALNAVIANAQTTQLQGRSLKMRTTEEGKTVVRTFAVA